MNLTNCDLCSRHIYFNHGLPREPIWDEKWVVLTSDNDRCCMVGGYWQLYTDIQSVVNGEKTISYSPTGSGCMFHSRCLLYLEENDIDAYDFITKSKPSLMRIHSQLPDEVLAGFFQRENGFPEKMIKGIVCSVIAAKGYIVE